jgi:hypothetical protein
VQKPRVRTELNRADAESSEVFGRILEEKLLPFRKSIDDLTTELRRATRRRRRDSDSIDPRKKFIAEIIQSRGPYPKMSVSEILAEANRRQHLFPKKPNYRPVPDWKVGLWTDMKQDNRAAVWIAKIRADPRYLPSEYLTQLGRERSTMNR